MSSGITVLLLLGESTLYSRFKIPLDFYKGSQYNIGKGTQFAGLIEKIDLIIQDEMSIQHKYCFETIHRILKDIRGFDVLFRRIPIILGGDFAQILLVICRANCARTIAVNLQQFFFWGHLTILRLHCNMRVQSGCQNQDFADQIRTFFYDKNLQNRRLNLFFYIRITTLLVALFDKIYPRSCIDQVYLDNSLFRSRVIFTARNDTITDVNNTIL